jgi:hypothetical protein
MIKLEAFEPFIAANTEMAAEGKYGVLVLTDGAWIATEITEADFGLYVQVYPQIEEQSDEDKALFDAAFEVNTQGHSAWILVELD